ncbi:hypothetical protein G173_gp201 [Erwinia phage phiEaH2]|nr:hypothetical protein G173_gp201 [Erwinia phage phiEaH2]AFQ96746.1 hypothetical protein [Erwinia phage phiEaH2]
MAYRNPSIASAAISEIRKELEERGCTDIVLHRGGEFVHITAKHPKKNREINVYAQPYLAQENK